MKTLIEMAREATLLDSRDDWNSVPDEYREAINAFAELVRADEREACAKVCDELIAPDVYSDTDVSMWDVTCIDCASAIRARSNT